MHGRLLTLVILGLFTACGSSIPLDVNEIPMRPVYLQVKAKAGASFEILYYVQNEEETFDGYNLYVARQPIADGDLAQLPAISLDGTTPSFRHNASEINLVTPQSRTISSFGEKTVYWDAGSQTNITNINYTSFSANSTYYFRLAAHSRFGRLSEGSNEVSQTALP